MEMMLGYGIGGALVLVCLVMIVARAIGWRFTRSPLANKMTAAASDYLDAQAKIRELQIDRKNIEQELEHERKRQKMVAEEESHKYKLEAQELRAKFDREKAMWDEDKKRTAKLADDEKELFKKNLEQKMKIEHDEAISLCKLDAQQQIKQAEINFDRQVRDKDLKHTQTVADIKAKHSEELVQRERSLFDQLRVEAAKIHSEGNVTTKFMQEVLQTMRPMPAVSEISLRNVSQAQLPEAQPVAKKK